MSTLQAFTIHTGGPLSCLLWERGAITMVFLLLLHPFFITQYPKQPCELGFITLCVHLGELRI